MPPDDARFKPDCRHYRGDKPCRFNRLCDGCSQYAPYDQRLVIIKIGALGDVIRTLCILPELRRQHRNAHLTWVTSAAAAGFIAHHPDIDRLLVLDALTCMALSHEQFDVLINLDKEPEPCGLAMSLRAGAKLGMGLSTTGKPVPMNDQARDYFALGLCDQLKFHQNRKSYPRLVHEALGLPYRGDRYALPLDEHAAQSVRARLEAAGWQADHPTLGVNVGSSDRFANKMWPIDRIAQVISALRQRQPDLQVLLLGGPDEAPLMQQLHQQCPWTIDGRSRNSAQEFVALLDLCDTVFCGDTLAMHLAIARQRRVVVFFGPTCEQEIELFGLGTKLIADVPCSPCYKRACDRHDACVHALSTEAAVGAIERELELTRRAGRIVPLRRAG